MRASYDSLFARVKSQINEDPFSGHLFLFVNRSRTSVKCLYYDGTGFVIIAKRLERGLFSRVNPLYDKPVVLTPAEFSLFFEGAALEKRFIDSPAEIRKKSLLKRAGTCDNFSHVTEPNDIGQGRPPDTEAAFA
jgi:transposase